MSRLDRVASLLKKEIAEILQKKVNDQRIGFVSIIDIKLSPDLSIAWIYYSHLGSEEDLKRTRRGLNSAKHFIRLELAKVYRGQTLPELRFVFDDSIQKGVDLVNKINSLADYKPAK